MAEYDIDNFCEVPFLAKYQMVIMRDKQKKYKVEEFYELV